MSGCSGRQRQAVQCLPRGLKEVLVALHGTQGSISDIANKMGLTEAAVKSRLCRARKRVKNTLDRASLRVQTRCLTHAPNSKSISQSGLPPAQIHHSKPSSCRLAQRWNSNPALARHPELMLSIVELTTYVIQVREG